MTGGNARHPPGYHHLLATIYIARARHTLLPARTTAAIWNIVRCLSLRIQNCAVRLSGNEGLLVGQGQGGQLEWIGTIWLVS